ncbi:hypothetical protein IMZ48_23130 [Candidatus Bathyarchaeota archaeon]|nr:hypothetical protein [Candidatus Bathyarchaeota archaeon]
MLVKSAVSAAALAATAHSFVIIPEVSPIDSAFAQVAPLNPSENIRAVSIDCSGCPVTIPAFNGGEPTVATDAPNHLEMTFAIDAAPEGDRLLANGFELYPNPDPFTGSLGAAQVLELTDMAAAAMGGVQPPASQRSLGYRLQVYPLSKDQESQFIEVIGVDLQVIEVGETFVDGIPLVKVLLGKKGDDLAIMDVKTFESTASVDPAAECTTWVCRFRALLAKKLATFRRPCPGKIANKFHGHHGAPHHAMPGDVARPQGGPPHTHHKQPHGHLSHPHHAGALKAVATVILNVLFPILLGIFVGVSVGL